MTMPAIIVAGALGLLLSLVIMPPADAQVPTAADSAACNEQAPRAVKTGTVSPTSDDHLRADSARSGALTTSARGLTDHVIESPDPQIHGMQAEGARDATFQAAYRSCMRRKGF